MFLNKQVSLNLNVRGLGPSATIAINERSKSFRSKERWSTVWGWGNPVSGAGACGRGIETARTGEGLSSVGRPCGFERCSCEFHRRKDGIEARAQDVLIGPGSKELMFLLQLVYYGELIVVTPCWVSYVPQAAILGEG